MSFASARGVASRLRSQRTISAWRYTASQRQQNNRYFHPIAQQQSLHWQRGQRQDDDDQQQQQRLYHVTVPSERAFAIIMGLGALSAASYGAATAVRTWHDFQAERAAEAARNPPPEEEEATTANATADTDESKESSNNTSTDTDKEKQQEGPRENVFASWFGVGVGSKYYEGGFEETMTRREAALILGVRESASVARVKDAHRKLLILNHPDTGGSTLVSGKINEAKELLLKGRKG